MKTNNQLTRPFAISLLSVLALMTACSAVPTSHQDIALDPGSLLHDEVFAQAEVTVEEPEFFFDLADNHKVELDRIMAAQKTEYDRYRTLRSWVFRRFDDFEFDSTETYSLGDLNTNRKINCLSFSAFFVAAARYVDVSADFQLVFAPPYWDSENGTWINNQHIDVTGSVSRRLSEQEKDYFSDSFVANTSTSPRFPDGAYFVGIKDFVSFRYVVDINPAIVSMPLKRRVLDDQQVLSLYYSNKSMEALLDQDVPLAYAYTKQALLTDPASSGAWNNLGVLYSRVDRSDLARDAFVMALEIDEEAHSARSNLANVYRQLGELESADTMAASVEEFRRNNPYYHQALAAESLNAGEYERAIDHLQDAVERKHNEQHFYHELAIAHQKLGNDDQVIENLVNARRYARGAEKIRFSGKVKALQELIESRQSDI